MRTPLALAAGAALLAGGLAVPSFAAVSASAPAEHSVDNACIDSVAETDPLEAGAVQICFSLFKPAIAAHRKVPLVFHSHGWGGSRTTDIAAFEDYLDDGFGVLSFDQRGFGESGGKAHVEDPAFEGQDVIALIDHVAGLPWVKQNGPGDPVLGAIGGSYGGGYQFVGAFTELMTRGKTRFDALAPEITWFSLNESLAPQDVVRTTWVAALYAAGADAHTAQVHAGLVEGSATGNWPQTMEEFFVDNGPAWHVAQGRKLDIPVLFGQGVTDNLFPLDQAISNFQQALTDEARTRSMVVGYNDGHVLPNVLPRAYGVSGDPCSEQLGFERFRDLARAFLVENLKGEKRGVKGFGQYHLATADGACVTVDSVAADSDVPLGTITTPAMAGPPQAIPVAQGPITIAGTPTLDAVVQALGLDSRAFFALSVGTSPADAQVVQNNVLPHHEKSLNLGSPRSIELPSVAVEVPEGQTLFLTVSPVSDMFVGHGSRTPSAMLLTDAVLNLPVVE